MKTATEQYNIVRRTSRIQRIAKAVRPALFGLFLILATLTPVLYTRGGERAHAAPNNTFNFQARLLSGSGAVAPDANTYSIQFNLYSVASGGSSLWNETLSGQTIKNGYLSVSLGGVTPFPNTIDWSEELWLTMNVNGDGEMNPRLKLTAVPLAMRAKQADGITNGANTLTANDLAQLAPGTAQVINSALAALRLNQTGAGGLLQLQNNGSDVFAVDNNGDVTSDGDATFAGGTLNLGDATQSGGLVLSDGSGNTATIQTTGLTANRTYTLPDQDGTICVSTGNCGGTGDVSQNGNMFGVPLTIGTNDGYVLNFETAGTTRLTIDTSGNANLTGALTAGTGLTVTAGGAAITGNSTINGTLSGLTGLTVVSGGANITGGLNNNSGGITNAGNITGVGANIAATAGLTIASTGANDLTLNSGSGTAVLGATSLRTNSTLALDLANALDTALNLGNGGAGIANLNLADGSLLTGGTARLSNSGVLQNVTGNNTNGVSFDANTITGGTLSDSRLSSNVTVQGNTFNGLNNLVKLDGSGRFVAIDASALTNLSAGNLVGQVSVANGGTGLSSITQNGILFGNGTSPAGVATGTSGQFMQLNGSGVPTFYTLGGDATLSAGSLTLATSGVVAGTYGSANQVPVFTVDAKGRVTGVTNTTISGVAPGGAASGDLSGSYPNPTVSRINGVGLGSTTATSGSLLIGSGTQWVSQAITGDVSLNAGGVTTIGNDAVTNSKILNSTITNAKLQNSGFGITYGSANISGGSSVSLGGTLNLTFSATPTFTGVTANTYTGAGAVTVSSGGSGDLTLDSASTKVIVADDLQVNGNDILDSAGTARIGLGATTTLTNTGLTLSGTTGITATSLSSITTASVLQFSGDVQLNGNDLLDSTGTTRLSLGSTNGLTGNLDISGTLVAGNNNAFQVNTDGDVTGVFTLLNGSTTATNNSGLFGAAGTSLNVGSGTNFDVGNYVLVNGTYAKITAKAGNTLTITPALVWTSGQTVTEYHIPEIGGTNTGSGLTSRYGRGYFIAGVATGNGTTYYNEDGVETSLGLYQIQTTANNGVINIGTNGSTSTVTIGGSGTTTTIAGSVTFSGNVTAPTTGTSGYLQRNGITLSPANSGDNFTTTGNISTTGSGVLSSAGGLTISAGGANISGGLTLATGALNLTAGGITNAGSVTGLTGLTFTSGGINLNSGGITNTGSLAAVTGITFTSGNLALGGGNISGAGSIGGASLGVSGTISANTTGTINGLSINAGALSGISTINASGSITAATSNTINGLNISSGAVTGVTGIAFTSGGLNLNSGGVTNAGTIGGVAGLTLTSGNLALGGGNITGAGTIGSGAITSTGLVTGNGLAAGSGQISGSGGLSVTGTSSINGNGITSTQFTFSGASGQITTTSNGDLTLAPNGSGSLVLNTGSGGIATTNISTLRRAASGGLAFELNDGANLTALTLNNTGAGAANLVLTDGAISTGSSPTVRLTNAGALQNITGLTLTAGGIDNGGFGITNAGTIGGVNGLTLSGGNLALGGGNITGGGTIGSGAITSTGLVTGNGLAAGSGQISGSGGLSVTGTSSINGNGITSTQFTFSGASGTVTTTANGDLTLSPNGSGTLGLNTGSGGIATTNISTLRRAASGGLTFELNDGSNATALTLNNTGAGAANLVLTDGAISTGSSPTVRLTNAGALQNITGLTVTANGIDNGGFGITNAGTIGGVNGLTLSGGNLTLGAANVTTTGTYNTNTFTSTQLTFGGATGSVTTTANGDLTVGPAGSGTLALNTGSGGVINTNATIIRRTTAGALNFELNNGSATSFVLNNTGAGAASLVLTDGDLATGAVPTVRLTNGGVLQNINGLAFTGGNITGAGTIGSGAITSTGLVTGLGLAAGAGQITGSAGLNVSGTITLAGTTSVSGANTFTVGTGLTSLGGGLSVTAGNFAMSGAGTFGTGTGAVSLNGATSVTGANTFTVGSGLTSLSGGVTATGIINLNNNANFAINLGTGTSTGAINIGGGSNALTINSTNFDVTSAGVVTATGNITTSGVYRQGASNGVTVTCTGSQYLPAPVVKGGIITGNAACAGIGLSDQRLKKNVAALGDDVLSSISAVNTVSFDFKCDEAQYANVGMDCITPGKQTGVLAQQLAQVFPELVYQDENGYYNVKYQGLSIYTLKAVQQLDQKVNAVSAAAAATASVNQVKTNGVVRIDQNGQLQNITGLNMVGGGASVVGGLNNNNGGIANAGAISGATTIAAETIKLTATGTNNLLELKKDGNGVFTVFNNGALLLQFDSDHAFAVKDAAGTGIFNVDSAAGKVSVGSANDSKTVLFVLDKRSLPDDPPGELGASYFNTKLERFRCYDGKWRDCLPAGDITDPFVLSKITWNLPAADTEFPDTPRMVSNLEQAHQYRIRTRLLTAAPSGAKCRIQYAASDNGPWNDLVEGGGGELAIDTAATLKSDWFTIAKDARKQDVTLRFMCRAGNGQQTVFNGVSMQVR